MYKTFLRPISQRVQLHAQQNLRFSTSSPLKMNEYLVTIPDHANALEKRLAARPAHLANLKPHIESGKVVFGGACLSKHPGEGETPDMTVSPPFPSVLLPRTGTQSWSN
jgi:hypothetical protein